LAASLVLDRLNGGTFTGLDRSEKMIALASSRNKQAVESGRAVFVSAPVDEVDFTGVRFDKVFLVNVNLHLHHPDRDLALIRSWLAPGGVFVGVSHPPVERKAVEYASLMPEILKAAGFEEVEVVTKNLTGGLATAVIARTLARPF
jgi:SAM-dependent methyltransferase